MSDIQQAVQEKYGAIAASVRQGAGSGCCGPTSCGCSDPITSRLYSDAQTEGLPTEAVLASLGCGNPTALAQLEPGQVVLDLGSGGGIDVLLSARRVGPTGKAYGLDMTDEMLALARENQQKAGATNVEFLKGTIESIPLPDNSVDVIISNCVINLSADKDAVLREAFRVLKTGGRLAVSDVVVRGEVPSDVRRSMELWVGCIAGALEEKEYAAKLTKAGFDEVTVEPWRVYQVSDAREFLAASGVDVDAIAREVDGRFASAFIRARKPEAKAACCGPGCVLEMGPGGLAGDQRPTSVPEQHDIAAERCSRHLRRRLVLRPGVMTDESAVGEVCDLTRRGAIDQLDQMFVRSHPDYTKRRGGRPSTAEAACPQSRRRRAR